MQPADVLVVFGITGDLAKVMTLRSLYSLERRGLLDFARQDSVEETWRVLQPLLDAPPPAHEYVPGTWGPAEADKLVSHYGGWHGPWTGGV